MAASVQILKESSRELIIKLVNYGTVESGVVKIDVSTLTNQVVGSTAWEVAITNVVWTIANGTVSLLWDATTDVQIASLAGTGSLKPNGSEQILLPNNSGAGKTGDVLLTTQDWGATSSYTIIIHAIKTTGFDRGGNEVGI